jgi:hypothetical protein
VLFFEFFPLFMAVVSVLVALRLIIADRKARSNPREQVRRRVPPPRRSANPGAERGGRRPSMSA